MPFLSESSDIATWIVLWQIDDLIDSSGYELFKALSSHYGLFEKIRPSSHSLYHLLPPVVQGICVCVIILFSYLNIIQICTRNCSLFDRYALLFCK